MPKIPKCNLNEYTIIDYDMELQRKSNKGVKDIPRRVRDKEIKRL